MFKNRKTTIPLLLACVVVISFMLTRQKSKPNEAPLDAALAKIDSVELGSAVLSADRQNATPPISQPTQRPAEQELEFAPSAQKVLMNNSYGKTSANNLTDAIDSPQKEPTSSRSALNPHLENRTIENGFAPPSYQPDSQSINQLASRSPQADQGQASNNQTWPSQRQTEANGPLLRKQMSGKGWQKNPAYRPESARMFVENVKSKSRPDRFASLDDNFTLPTSGSEAPKPKSAPAAETGVDWDLELPGSNTPAKAAHNSGIQSVFEAKPSAADKRQGSADNSNDPVLRNGQAPPLANGMELPGSPTPKTGDRQAPVGNPSFVPQAWATTANTTLPESVLHKSVHRIEYGKSLARKGSTFSAREEFVQALQLLAQGYDSQMRTNRFSKAFTKAMIAIREAEDFSNLDTLNSDESSLGFIVEGHNSSILTKDMAKSIGPIGAMQQYLQVAHEQLAEAVGQNPVSAEALYCLGKLHSEAAKIPGNDGLGLAKAIVFHRTALKCQPQQFKSANELGTLLARSGQLVEAKELLKQSLRVQQHPTTWRNLATIHERLGEHQLAKLAQNEYALAISQPNQASNGQIQWMSTEQFNKINPAEFPNASGERAVAPETPPMHRTANKRSFPSFNWPMKGTSQQAPNGETGNKRSGPFNIF